MNYFDLTVARIRCSEIESVITLEASVCVLGMTLFTVVNVAGCPTAHNEVQVLFLINTEEN